jgi:hypothetical protein
MGLSVPSRVARARAPCKSWCVTDERVFKSIGSFGRAFKSHTSVMNRFVLMSCAGVSDDR